MADLQKLARAMCSIDLAESQWTQELPRLPVPDLWLTVSRYLASLKSVLAPGNSLNEMLKSRLINCKLTREQIAANWAQYEHTDQLVKLFMLNEGPELQRDLKEYANKCQNWATEFWLQDMYLSNALPLPVNSNPFFLFPRQMFVNSNEMLMFATRLIQFSVDFKYRIDQQALKQDFGSGHGRGKALCMETYKNFFHSYRMPHEDMDRLLPQSRRSNHIVVASCDQFYILRLGQDPLDNPYRKDISSQLNETSIFEQLLRIYRVSREQRRRQLAAAQNNADKRNHHSRTIPKVGLFTTENRKQWARMHRRLCHYQAGDNSNQLIGKSTTSGGAGGTTSGSNSPNTNTESLRLIEDCLFVMCLDSLVGQKELKEGVQSEPQNVNDQELSSEQQVYAANVVLTGGGSHLFTANRWFDKFLQIIVGRDGICGINIEHSASEGITVLRFLEEFLAFIKSKPPNLSPAPTLNNCISNNTKHHFDYNQNDISRLSLKEPGGGGGGTNPLATAESITSASYEELESPSGLLEESENIIKPLTWQLNHELEQALDEAEARVNKLVNSFSLIISKFNHFGRSFIKSQHLSPDAFIQLALQYTFFKLHGQLVSTYESASLRQFRLGRVDNIRANTCEAYQWIQAMLTCLEDQKQEETIKQQEKCLRPFKEAESAFIKAITKQVEILRYTISGSGPDNHLLALRELAKIRYGPEELPQLFQDASYQEYLNFRLSTSQLPNESGITVGYGAVVPAGYGCSYNPCEDKIIFCVSSFVEPPACGPATSSAEFAQTLEQSLLEMRQLCLGQQQQVTGGARKCSR